MNAHVDQWMGAYLDGELPNGRRLQLEKHLAGCERCQAMLEQRTTLSSLLQEAPAARGLKPTEQFVSEVKLQMLRQRRLKLAPAQPQSLLHLTWQFMPVGLILALAFLQAVSTLSNALDVIPGARAIVQQGLTTLPSSIGLPAPAQSNLGSLSLQGLSLLGPFNLLDWNWFTSLAALASIGILYLGWLASWWARTQQHQTAGLDI